MTGEYEKFGGFPPELTLDDKPGPAAHLPRGKADAMIENALLAAGFGPAEVAAPVAIETKQQARTRRFTLLQAAAAALIAFLGIGSASAAVMWFAKRNMEPTVEQLVERPVKKATRTPRPKPVITPEVSEKAEPIELDEIEVSYPIDDKTRTRKPEDWLEEANRLRAQKRWKDADETYARVWQAAPHSDAAYVARVASAGVRLDHLHDPKIALARYKNALKVAPAGPLSEEARYGIAEAYRAMGDRKAERAALEAFVAKHPDAGLTIRAKKRMLELDSSR